MELSKEKKSPTVRHLGQKYWRQFLTVKISAENSFSTPDFFYFWSHFWTVSSSPSYKSSFDSFLRGASIELSKAKKSLTVRRWAQNYWRQFSDCQNVRKKSDFWFAFFCILALISKVFTLDPRIRAHSIPFCKMRRLLVYWERYL